METYLRGRLMQGNQHCYQLIYISTMGMETYLMRGRPSEENSIPRWMRIDERVS